MTLNLQLVVLYILFLDLSSEISQYSPESTTNPPLIRALLIDSSFIWESLVSMVTPSEQTGSEGLNAALYATTVM